MPIEFACDCGKQFRVAEAHAGKRTKCPACGIALSVPTQEEPLGEEDAAYRALSEGPEPAPSSRDWRDPGYASPPPAPVTRPMLPPPPPPPPPKKKKKKTASSDPYAERERQWVIDWGKVGGGLVAVVLGTALLLGGLAMNRFFIWSPIIIIGGFFSIINGLLTKE